MARFTALSFDTGTVGASGGVKTLNVSIPSSYINVYKIKVVPTNQRASATLEIFKKDTFLAADRIYRSSSFTGTFVDPIENHNELFTERAKGFLFPYEDDDASTEMHLKVTNNYSQNQIFTITIYYEVPVTSTPTVDVDPIDPGVEMADFDDTDLWIPYVPPSKFGLSLTSNGDGTVTFATSVTSSSGLHHSVGLMSRFFVTSDVNTGCIVVRSAWQNIDIKPAQYSNMDCCIAHGLIPVGAGDTPWWGVYMRHKRGSALDGYVSQGITSLGPNAAYTPTARGSTLTNPFPISNWQMKFKHGRQHKYASSYRAAGMDERISYYKLEGNPWGYSNIGGDPPPVKRGGLMCGKFRLFVGLHCYDYLESGLYATLTGVEVEEGLIVPF